MRRVGVATAAGEAGLERRYYWSPGAAGCPADGLLGTADWPASLSPGAREMCCLMGMACPFATAAQDLRRVGGLRVCRERLRQAVEAEAQLVGAARESGGLLRPSFKAADLSAPSPGRPAPSPGRPAPSPGRAPRLYVGLDGFMVPTVTDAEKLKRRRSHAARRAARTRRGVKNLRPLPPRRAGTDGTFKEAKAGIFYDQSKGKRHAFVTTAAADAAGDLLRGQAALVGLGAGVGVETRSVTDAAAWIVRQLDLKLPMLGGKILDVYHLAEHVHRAAEACLGEGADAARAWARAAVAGAKARGPDALLAAIDLLGRSPPVRGSPARREALRALRAYVENHRDMMGYPTAIAGGWDVGSGPTEALCKSLSLRVKGPGMKWDLEHVEGMMTLKATYAGGQARAYWDALAATAPPAVPAPCLP